MEPLAWLVLAAAMFVGTHLLLAHPLRRTLVSAIGERGFLGLYVAIAFATFGLMIAAAARTPQEPPLWVADDALWALATAMMWFGSILFVGSFERNPAFPMRAAILSRGNDLVRGVFAVTRHPMNWGFAIWGLVHVLVIATPSGVVVGTSVLLLALIGSVGQDIKKRRLVGPAWEDWLSRTSFIPFWNGLRWPGTQAVVGGTVFFLLATWIHQLVAPIPAGLWRWIH